MPLIDTPLGQVEMIPFPSRVVKVGFRSAATFRTATNGIAPSDSSWFESTEPMPAPGSSVAPLTKLLRRRVGGAKAAPLRSAEKATRPLP